MAIKKIVDGKEAILKQQRMEDEFVSRLLAIAGDVRMFAMAQPGDTTTTTEKSKNADVITWSESLADFDAPVSKLGEGYAWDFNGTDEEGDSPDASDDTHTFSDGTYNDAFSVMALINPDTVSTEMSIVAKDAGSSDREWYFALNTSGDVYLNKRDTDVPANIARYSSPLTVDTWTLVSVVDPGTNIAASMNAYVDGVVDNDAVTENASWIGMNPSTATLEIAQRTGANFFDGSIAFILLTGKELNADEQWAIKELVNWFYGLSL